MCVCPGLRSCECKGGVPGWAGLGVEAGEGGVTEGSGVLEECLPDEHGERAQRDSAQSRGTETLSFPAPLAPEQGRSRQGPLPPPQPPSSAHLLQCKFSASENLEILLLQFCRNRLFLSRSSGPRAGPGCKRGAQNSLDKDNFTIYSSCFLFQQL